jgi:FHA domain
MAKKTLGRKAKPKASAAPARAPKKAAAPKKFVLSDADQELVTRLADRTGLLPAEILERALAGYAAAVAPGMPLRAPPPHKGKKGDMPAQRLFLSVDGKPEIEVAHSDFTLGSGEGVDLRLDLPLISARHARIIWRDGRHLFEDLRSARGSFRLGQPLDVRFVETGDEIDLGGFLPVRFRLE